MQFIWCQIHGISSYGDKIRFPTNPEQVFFQRRNKKIN